MYKPINDATCRISDDNLFELQKILMREPTFGSYTLEDIVNYAIEFFLKKWKP